MSVGVPIFTKSFDVCFGEMNEIREYSRIVKRRKVEDHGALCRKIMEEGIRDWSIDKSRRLRCVVEN